MVAYGLLLVTRCWLFSVTRSSVAHLYPLLADQLSLLSSLLATRLMLLLLLAYQRTLLLVSCCSVRAIAIHLPSCQLFSLKILVTSLLLHDVFSTLLSLCYWKLATHYNLFAVCSPLLLCSCFSLVGPLLFRCSLLTVHRTFAQCLLRAHRYYMLAAHDSPFAFFCFRLVADKSSCVPFVVSS